MDLLFISASPFLLAVILSLPVVKGALGKGLQSLLASALMVALFLWLLLLSPQLSADGALVQAWDWLPALGIRLSFYLDGLSLLFALIITGIGALIFFYAGQYFDEDSDCGRFLFWILGFAGAMLAVVLAGNLLLLFIAWELTSITSFMLISFKGGQYRQARIGAFNALIVTGAGALALIVGIVMLGFAAGQLTQPADGAVLVTEYSDLLSLKELAQHEWFPLLCLLIVIGGFSKSAQFPLHFWLPGAMSAPTPASAYLHSATMVKAGIYLFARLSPLMYSNELWTGLLLGFGMLTMLVGAVFAVKQDDLKGLLAYSTVSKLGAIVALIGLPEQAGMKAALVCILAHALYKSALFLVAGTIDHSTGTRVIAHLGGLRRQLPLAFVVTVISALSMAGMPFLFGFVAKETLIAALLHTPTPWTALLVALMLVSTAFTALAAYMLIADVFLGAPRQRLQVHLPPAAIHYSPLILALGSLSFGILLEPFIIPLLRAAVKKPFELVLFAGVNDVFVLSLIILLAGYLLFRLRWHLIARIHFPLAAERVYREFTVLLRWTGTTVLRSQSGNVRFYLAVILGAVCVVLILWGGLGSLFSGRSLLPTDLALSSIDIAKTAMLLLAVMMGLLTVILREHVKAAIAYGVMGYAIGVIFLIQRAPDVALVQLLMETMMTVLLIAMLRQIHFDIRKNIFLLQWMNGPSSRLELARDLFISGVIGGAVFIFSLTALQNRPQRQSIAEWHLQNAELVQTEDVVGAIIADFRGTDTLLEIAVFTIAALGLLTLLAGRPRKARPEGPAVDVGARRLRPNNVSTPFTRSVSTIVLPVAILIGFEQILYGGRGPGDGFTAGITVGLAISLLTLVLGYEEAQQRLSWFRPFRIVRFGLCMALANAIFPIFLGKGFMGNVQIDRDLGIYDLVGSFGLHITTSLLFEIAIALTVMGGIGIIIDAIAYAAARNGAQKQEQPATVAAGGA